MGKISQGVLGGFSGKVGNIIGGSWKGIDYMRVKASSVKDANTIKQQNQRAKFKACVSLAKSVMTTIVRPIWNRKAIKMTGFNLFVKTNLPVFDNSGAISDYPNLKFSIGQLPLPTDLVIINNGAGGGALRATWVDNSGIGFALPTDKIRIIAMCDGELVELQGLSFSRQTEWANFNVPFGTGSIVHVYAYFQNDESSLYSTSAHTLLTIT
ncbi:hypothetical protein EV201_0629 [Ancylomarina subtilis]|uniref:Uncharacterized protein n=1 Tax=Ancylomarina subtilis TaxID=1639035 RepID=A0A4Q7VIL6_9BACT|nr:DUF6266 family protein [Ancylomarina subtilis]RZT96000.1 hypothetical protein EV201_0629 [Ancylomarina subtilis]